MNMTENSIPAGLSHRLKPARCAALAVEKVTAVGRLQEAGRVAGAVSLRSYLVLEKRAMLFSSQSHNVVLWNNHILGIKELICAFMISSYLIRET